MRFTKIAIVLIVVGCFLISGCEKDEKATSADGSLKTPGEKEDPNDKLTLKDADDVNSSEKKGEVDKTNKAENEKIISNEINTDVLPPEIDTPIVKGLRVNLFVEKKKFKLGEPMNIYTVIRNKTNRIIKLNLKYNQNTQSCYFSMNVINENYPPLTGYFSGANWSRNAEINISPNATYCIVNDIQHLFSEHWTGKFDFLVFLTNEIWGNSEYINSNKINFEVVEKLDEKDEKNIENVNSNVLPPEIESPIIKGLQVNVFAEKKKFKLGEPMNIFVVLRNKSDENIKLNLKYNYDSENIYFSIHAINEELPPHTGYTSALSNPKTVEVNLSPNVIQCYIMDIEHYFNVGWLAEFLFYVNLEDDLPGGTESINSNKIIFEVVEELDEIEENNDTTIKKSIQIPEIETSVVRGIRVNVFAEKKKYKLGEPIKIYTVLRNKSDNIIKLNIKYDNTAYASCFSYSLFNETKMSSNLGLATGFPARIACNISPNGVYVFQNDIQNLFDANNKGKFNYQVYINDEFENKDKTAKSNTIRFEVVEKLNEDDKECNKNNNFKVLFQKVENSDANGLQVNVFPEKKKFKLGEPMNIFVVMRNNSDKIIKRTLNLNRSSSDNRRYCGFSYTATNEKGYPEALTDSGHDVTTTNIPPNGVYCYKVDIQDGFNINQATGKMNLTIFFYDELIRPVSIDIEVTR